MRNCWLVHLFAVRHAHPANQQPPSVGGKRGLRGVELKASIKLVKGSMSEVGGVVIKIASEPGTGMYVEKALLFMCNALRAANQESRLPKSKQIWAFPHIASVAQPVQTAAGNLA